MHVLYVHQYFQTPDAVGGIRSYEFARRLVARGHSVEMITSCDGAETVDGHAPGTWRRTVEAGIDVHWCRVDYSNHMTYARRMRAFAEFAVRATRRLRTLHGDVVFATSTPLTVAVPAVLGVSDTPMVFEVRDVWPEVAVAMGALANPLARRAAHALEAWAYRNAEHVVALSPGMASSITSRFPDVPVTVVPNSSDRALFANRDAEGAAVRASRPWIAGRPLVLYAGTFGRANDVSYLVRLAAQMRHVDPEVRFLLIGDGAEWEATRDLAERTGVLGVNVAVERPVPKREVPALFAAADCCASVMADVPELEANSANKAFDAFAAGRPLVINHGGWLAETIESSGAGFTLDRADLRGAASRLADRLRDPAWMGSARAASSRLASEEFDRDLLYERLEAVLEQVGAADRVGAQRDTEGRSETS